MEKLILIATIVALLVVVGLVLLFITFGNQKNKILKQKEFEQLSYEKRLQGVELQALRSQMNPHFVHNSLNAIQYYVQSNDLDSSEEYLSKFSKLIRLFFDFSRKQTVTLDEELHLLENYLQIEQLRFEDKLNYSIDVDSKLDTDDTIIPAMLLQPIIENAVNHGIFHKQSKGHINVRFESMEGDTYKVTVQDDGIGINAAKKLKENASKNYNSRSSAVLDDRLSLLNESGNWEVDYSIVDLSETGEGTGTRVVLIFTQVFE